MEMEVEVEVEMTVGLHTRDWGTVTHAQLYARGPLGVLLGGNGRLF